MATKYYAVRVGRVPGIYLNWEDCKAQVDGYAKAQYKSFNTASEAAEYIKNAGTQNITDAFDKKIKKQADDTNIHVQNLRPKKDESREEEQYEGVLAYVDGSYNKNTGEFSYGMVVLEKDKIYRFAEKFFDEELSLMHNVAGEIKGAMAAMIYAREKGLCHITIFHDYEGIAKWCLGQWKTNKKGTKDYKAFYDQMAGYVDIRFVKVTGHSGDTYNEMADRLAKQALGLIEKKYELDNN